MPQIEIKIWTVKEGKVEEIMIPEFNNKIFVVKKEADVKIESPLEKGETIFERHNQKIYKNVYKEVKQHIDSGKSSRPDVMIILKKYYPHYKKQSLKILASFYRGYVEGKYQNIVNKPTGKDKGTKLTIIGKCLIYDNILNELKEAIKQRKGKSQLLTIIKQYSPNAKEPTLNWYLKKYKSYIKQNKPLRVKRRRRKKPTPDSVRFNKKYHYWIKQEDIMKVKRGINTVGFNYRPTIKNIQKQTGLDLFKIRAVLDDQFRRGNITIEKEGREKIYRMK